VYRRPESLVSFDIIRMNKPFDFKTDKLCWNENSDYPFNTFNASAKGTTVETLIEKIQSIQ